MRPTRLSRRIGRRITRKGFRSYRPQWDLFEDRTLLSLLATTTTLTPSVQSPLSGTSETFTAAVTSLAPGSGAAPLELSRFQTAAHRWGPSP